MTVKITNWHEGYLEATVDLFGWPWKNMYLIYFHRLTSRSRGVKKDGFLSVPSSWSPLAKRRMNWEITFHVFYTGLWFLTQMCHWNVSLLIVISVLRKFLQKMMISLNRPTLYLIGKIKPAEFLITEKRVLSPVLF